MKWILLIGMTLLASACVTSTTEVVEYRQVSVAPLVEPVVVEGAYPVGYAGYEGVPYNPGVVDITTTAVDFY